MPERNGWGQRGGRPPNPPACRRKPPIFLAWPAAGAGFAVLGFPSNEFGGQEPGSPEQIRSFCERNYGVAFPLFAKGETKPGAGQSPVYAFLTRSGDVPNWNFCKYLVGRNGEVRAFFPSNVAPDDRALRQAVDAALAAPA